MIVRVDALRSVQPPTRRPFQQRHEHAVLARPEGSTDADEAPWLNHGLLFSSFSDGLSRNDDAQDFLRRGLVQGLLLDACARTERAVEKSVVHSPCNGPNMEAMESLGDIDAALLALQNGGEDPFSLLPDDTTPEVRFVYIPTALYALRPDSINTPGKQRQRARVDGKKRRDRIVQWLTQSEIVPPTTRVRAVTVDLDDASVKQPQGGESDSDSLPFPTSGKEALEDWRPHLVYVEGGNTFWLTHCVDKGSWLPSLVRAASNPATVYCGSSAGAILAGARVETACWKGWDDPRVVPDRAQADDWIGASGLGLVGPHSFFPHMNDSWNDLVAEKMPTLSAETYCLRDEDVMRVRGSDRSCRLTSARIEEAASLPMS
jgi:peptidase E